MNKYQKCWTVYFHNVDIAEDIPRYRYPERSEAAFPT